ncbi:MAG: histidinol-phosphate transaminase [Bacillota bacterium]
MKFCNARTRALDPYTPGEQPRIENLVKLNTNENPYPPSPRAIEAMRAAVGEGLRLYPDPESVELRRAVAKRHNVSLEQVFVGNGSDEVLAFAVAALADPGLGMRFFDITYSFYPVYAQLMGIPAHVIALNDDLTVPIEKCFGNDSMLLFPNPNAPTSLALPLEAVRLMVESNPDHAVVVDEAYVEFGAQSAVELVNGYENLLVIRTLSKSHALAGLRVGYAVGSAGIIEGLNRVKNSFNSYPLDRIAQAGATAALLDEDYLLECSGRIQKTRAKALRDLRALGFDCPEALGNFLFARHPQKGGRELFAALRAQGVLVRRFDKPRIGEYLRISIGTDEQMQRLIEALQRALGEG